MAKRDISEVNAAILQDGTSHEENIKNSANNIVNEEEGTQLSKRIKFFSPRNLRASLKCSDRVEALESFLKHVQDPTTSETVLKEYIEAGGSCLELLQVLEYDSPICPPVIVLELVQYLIGYLKSHDEMQHSTLEACYYLLNMHLPLVNKLLHLSSSAKEKIIMLKVLAAIVRFSPSPVKAILFGVNFRLNLLIKHEENPEQSIRLAFIDFICAFFIDQDNVRSLQLVNKPFLLLSIMPGLQYDPAKQVRIFLVNMKKSLIDNESVHKPLRIKVFNNKMVKCLVNLYDWRGPSGINTTTQIPVKAPYVDLKERQLIAERVHECLLVLCTSIKRGLVFRDESLGFGKLHRNPLMFSIIDSLSNYFGCRLREELIVRMAVEFPDLMRAVWGKLLPNLEPRPSVKWFQAIQFMRLLLDRSQPDAFLRYAKLLNPLQYAQAIQMLAAPRLVLRTLFSANFTFDCDAVKLEVAMTLHSVLRVVQKFLVVIKANLPVYNWRVISRLIAEHLCRNMPPCQMLIDDWMRAGDSLEYTTIVLKMLLLYHELCPELVTNWQLSNSAKLVLLHIEPKPLAEEITAIFKVTLIEVLVELDPGCLNISGDLFPLAVDILSVSLKETEGVTSSTARDCLHQILNLTGLFEDYAVEVLIWTESLRHKHMPKFFCEIICNAHECADELTNELKEFRKNEAPTEGDDFLQELCSAEGFSGIEERIPKPVSFSSVLLSALKQEGMKTRVKRVLGEICIDIFHLQTDYTEFQHLVRKYSNSLNDSVQAYILNWYNENIRVETEYLPLRRILEISTAIFKVLNVNPLPEEMFTACLQLVQNHAPHVIDLIYSHPKLYADFLPDYTTHIKSPVRFLSEVTQYIRTVHNIDLHLHLKLYRTKVSDVISQLLSSSELESIKMRSKSSASNFCQVIDVIGLNQEDCQHILRKINLKSTDLLDNEGKPNLIYSILVTSLNSCIEHSESTTKSLAMGNIPKVLNILTELNYTNVDSSELAKAINKYLTYFKEYLTNEEDENLTELFKSCVLKEEYCRENALLALYIYEFSIKSVHASFEANLEAICTKKGLILPFLYIVNFDFDRQLAEKTFNLLTPLLERTLAKPQKAGAHFENHYLGFCYLIRNCMPSKDIARYLNKIQKFDTNEAFLAAFLGTMFVKYFSETKQNSEAYACNGILTLIHLAVNIFKTCEKKNDPDEGKKLQAVAQALKDVCKALPRSLTLPSLKENATFKQFYKLCLKHGIASSKSYLLDVITTLECLVQFSAQEVEDIMDMLTGHSEFMDVALAGPSDAKRMIFKVVHGLCNSQKGAMQRKYVPFLLASYTATLHPADRCILSVLRLYEDLPTQTGLYDLKPFLWGISAANFYLVRSETRHSLRRVPRTGDVLDILEMEKVESTLVYFPLDTPHRESHDLRINSYADKLDQIYDLWFLLASFSQVMQPENRFLPHKFTRSGALSLVVISFASSNKELRLAACHALARFYYHLEAKRGGKEQVIWLRFIEGLCKGTGSIENIKLNNFAALFMARTALVLSNPTDPMYAALSNFIGVKAAPVLTKIPELYTFLHSSDVEYITYRHFILRILLDGMRSVEDFAVALKAMAFKLIMELFNSSLCDTESRGIILDVIDRAVSLPQAAKELNDNYGLVMWLYNIRNNNEPQLMDKVHKISKEIKKYRFTNINILFQHETGECSVAKLLE